jgi:bacterioferritin
MRATITGASMQGDPLVIQHLQAQLKNELTVTNQYFLHYRILKHWGLDRMAKHEYEESIGEMKHADRLTDRILLLDGLPNYQRLDKLHIGQTVPEQMQADLALEMHAIKLLNDGIALCRERGDNGTEALLKEILLSEEEHVDWIETQLRLIEHLGEGPYLAEQM